MYNEVTQQESHHIGDRIGSCSSSSSSIVDLNMVNTLQSPTLVIRAQLYLQCVKTGLVKN